MTLAWNFYRLYLANPDSEFMCHGPDVFSRGDTMHAVLQVVAQLEESVSGGDVLLGSSTEDPIQRTIQMIAASWAGYQWLLSGTRNAQNTLGCLDIETLPQPKTTTEPRSDKPTHWSADRSHWTLFSSGTTGEPKCIELTWAQIEASAEGARERFRMTEEDRWLCVLSLGHIAGASIVARACVIGHQVAFGGKFDAEQFHKLVEQTRATVTSLVPTMLSLILKVRDTAPPTLRVVMLGGAASSDEVRRQAADWPLWITWGMSETASHVATSSLREFYQHGLRPIAGHRLFEAPDGHIGIEGPVAPGGYWITSDFGRVTDDGFVSIDGRSDDVVKVSGNRVNLSKVRRAFAGVLEQAAHIELFTVPDEVLGVQVVAAVQGVDLQTLQLGDQRFASLEQWELPHWLMAMDDLPLTSRYKVDRAELSREWSRRVRDRAHQISRMQVLPGPAETRTTIDSSIHVENQGRVTL